MVMLRCGTVTLMDKLHLNSEKEKYRYEKDIRRTETSNTSVRASPFTDPRRKRFAAVP